jgi:hypothetical protein
MKKSKIAEYARMASIEAHDEYMALNARDMTYYVKDILSEIIDKFDTIEAMASRRWYHKLFTKIS